MKSRILSSLLIIVLCSGFISTAIPSIAMTAAQPNATTNAMSMYASILDDYRQAVLSAEFMVTDGYKWQMYVFHWEPLQSVTVNFYSAKGTLEEYCGYAFRDLNGDQRPELILLSKDYDIYAIITLIDGDTPNWFPMDHPYDGGVFFSYFLNEENTFAIKTYDVNNNESVTVYQLSDSGDELIPLTTFGYDVDYDSDEEEYPLYYYKAENGGERTIITQLECERLMLPYFSDRNMNRANLTFLPLFGDDAIYATDQSRPLSIARAQSPTHPKPDGVYNYGPDKVLDSSENTSWQYNSKSRGVNGYQTSIVLELSAAATVETLRMKNGFWAITNGNDQYWCNNRVKEATISFQYAGSTAFTDPITYTFIDEKKVADIDLGSRESVKAIKFQIESVYSGSKFDDVAVTHMVVIGY